MKFTIIVIVLPNLIGSISVAIVLVPVHCRPKNLRQKCLFEKGQKVNKRKIFKIEKKRFWYSEQNEMYTPKANGKFKESIKMKGRKRKRKNYAIGSLFAQKFSI